MNDVNDVRVTARVTGTVQGVGFRWFVRRQAERLGLAGHAVNLADGSVEVVAEGPREACEHLIDELRAGQRRPGRVDRVTAEWATASGETPGAGGFTVG